MSPLGLEEVLNCYLQMKGNWLGSPGTTREPVELKPTINTSVTVHSEASLALPWTKRFQPRKKALRQNQHPQSSVEICSGLHGQAKCFLEKRLVVEKTKIVPEDKITLGNSPSWFFEIRCNGVTETEEDCSLISEHKSVKSQVS